MDAKNPSAVTQIVSQVEEIKGSLFPLHIGASLTARYTITVGTMAVRVSSQCTIGEKVDAATVDNRLSGTARKKPCTSQMADGLFAQIVHTAHALHSPGSPEGRSLQTAYSIRGLFPIAMMAKDVSLIDNADAPGDVAASLKSVEVKGSFYPPHSGAVVSMKYVLSWGKVETKVEKACILSDRIEASTLGSNLPGAAWKMRCSGVEDGKLVDETNYLLEDLGISLALVGVKDLESQTFVIAKPGFRQYSFRKLASKLTSEETNTYTQDEWRYAEAE